MKPLKFLVTIIFIFIISITKIAAQPNNEEAILTYQLAQEEYEKANYQKVMKYLDKVESLNPDAKTKTSYLRAMCIDKQLTITPDDDNLMLVLINNIDYYIANGKDEDKKTELLKIKIKIASTDNYSLVKEFESVSRNEALQMLVEAQRKFPHDQNVYTTEIYSAIRLNDRYLNIFTANKQIKPTNFVSAGNVVLTVYQLDLIKNKILKLNGQYVFATPIDRYDEVDYKNETRFKQFVEEDISNYLLYKYESHGKHEFQSTLLNNQWGNNNIKNVGGLIYHIYDQKKAGDKYNQRMIFALKILSKK